MRPGGITAALLATGLVILLTASCGGTDRNGAFRELATPNAVPCCTDFKVGYDMTVTDFGVEPSARGSFAAFAQAMGDYVTLSTKLLDDVTSACRSIALDLGGTEDDRGLRGRTGEEATYAWCNLAVRKLQRELTDTLQPTGRLSFLFGPALCTVDEPYIQRCENACAKDESCEEKGVAARCDAAHLSGSCTSKCTGACLGAPGAPALCEGKCEGECEGTCLGDCTGTCGGAPQNGGGRCRSTCVGICGGFCNGRCTGVCHLGKPSSGRCDGPCEGGCSTPLKAPKCEADLKAPACEGSTDCEAFCKASGQARASCTSPSILIGSREDFGNELAILAEIKSLERNLAILFSAARGRGPLFEGEAKAAYEAGEQMVNGNSKISLKAQACARVMLAAGEQSLQNVHVAIQASKSVLMTLPLEP